MGIIKNKLEFCKNIKVFAMLEALELAIEENNSFSVSILLKRLENEGFSLKPLDENGNIIVQ